MPEFHLIQYLDSSHPKPLDLRINGRIERTQSAIELVYTVSGILTTILWPAQNARCDRKDRLWKHTCFELFISPDNTSRYIEYNFSPSGDWNAYEFEAYRIGQRDLYTEKTKNKIREENDNCLRIVFEIPLIESIKTSTIHIGISAILEDHSNNHHYFALCHVGDRPDFHLRDSFSLAIDAEPV